ncbi:MAG TPA: hypothetical protein PKD54_05780 [Pirellulaceae bacterium]|nr:hypothetical protein [Pirellulaceae bacterium]
MTHLHRLVWIAGLWVCAMVPAEVALAQQGQPLPTPLVIMASEPRLDALEFDLHQLALNSQDPEPEGDRHVQDSLFRPIQQISLEINKHRGQVPEDRAAQLIQQIENRWPLFEPSYSIFCWEAPNIGYQPLYFEDVALERYGQTCHPGRQVVASTVHFGASFLTLPYHLMIDPSWNCESPYGYCRPGDIAPCTRPRFFYRW